MRGAQECTGSTRGGKRPSLPGHQCPPGDTVQGRRQQGAFPTPGKQRLCLGPVSTLICGLGCREVEGGGEKMAAELRPLIGLDNMEDQEGADCGAGWTGLGPAPDPRPPCQKCSQASVASSEKRTRTHLLALLRWVQGGDTSRWGRRGRRWTGGKPGQARPGEMPGLLRSCSRGNHLQRRGSELHAVLHFIRI